MKFNDIIKIKYTYKHFILIILYTYLHLIRKGISINTICQV